MADTKKLPYIYAVGRRKTAVARVRYYKKGEGEIEVNGQPFDQYFDTKEMHSIVKSPLKLANMLEEGKITIRVVGGGKKSQSESVRLGIARALLKLNEDLRQTFKESGYLTRDSRKKERKKPGLKRARRAPQWSKR